jgi:hypothetical protein
VKREDADIPADSSEEEDCPVKKEQLPVKEEQLPVKQE